VVGDLEDDVGVLHRAEAGVAELLGAAADGGNVVPRPPIPDVLTVALEFGDQGAGAEAELVSYPGVGHAFFWPGTPPFDAAARDDASARIMKLLAS